MKLALPKSIRQVRDSHELLWNLTLRELRTKYRNSFLGWGWSLLNPLATVAIYSYVFGHLFGAKAPSGLDSGIEAFALYLLCALLPWNFLTLVTGTGMDSLVGNASLIKKVAFPREVLVFANSLHGVVQFLIELTLLSMAVTLAGNYFFDLMPILLLQILFLLMFATGIALALAALNVYFRDLSYLWQVFTQVWFFATPIVYTPALLEERAPTWAIAILDYNPMAVYGQGFRRTMYDGVFPGWDNLLACAAVGLVAMAGGWMVFVRLSRRFAEEL